MVSLSDKYGEIYRLHLGGKPQLGISSYRLVNEACDESRFKNSISAPLAEIRHGVHDGLFTAQDGEPNWGVAHRILMPAFGPMAISGMFDEMHDIGIQLAMKWARHGSNASIMATEDFTRLSLDTFLIAGHETTSGLLSFAFYMLFKHPEAYSKAQKEVDNVIGKGQVEVEHMSKLPYLSAILRETLRLQFPIPIILVEPIKNEVIGGQYFIPANETMVLLLYKSHLDPAVYGDDVNDFKPERMLKENFDRLNETFPNCWKPFGNGIRSCIGRPFAWQEALLVTAMLLQNFNFVLDDPSYSLAIKQTLTIKPKGFRMRAFLRDGLTPTQLEHRLAGTSLASDDQSMPEKHEEASLHEAGRPFSIYYGSDSGTCESLAYRLAADAVPHGFHAAVVDCMDSANGKLPTDRPVVFITASYEGEPTDNAAFFLEWLENVEGGDHVFKNVSYAVFGCGHHDWASTFHRIPRLVDSLLVKRGGSRKCEIGLADAASGDILSVFESWEDEVFWPAMTKEYGSTSHRVVESGDEATSLGIEICSPRASFLRQDVSEACVVESYELTTGAGPTEKYTEIKLPAGMTYKAGDYLVVLPLNPRETIGRVMRHYKLPWDAHLTLKLGSQAPIPMNTSLSAYDIFGAYVELTQPATRRNILTLTKFTDDESVKVRLQALSKDNYASEVVTTRFSVLDLLEFHPSIDLPLHLFLSMLPPMRVRQYSIASSPLWNPGHVVIAYSVLDAPARANTANRHIGVATNHLSSLSKGDCLRVSIRPSHTAFRLPSDSENIPILMVASGTGLAPFRGFMQERAAMVGAGRKLASAILFFGCREPIKDDIYRKELDMWEQQGVVLVRRASSRKSEQSEGCKYVQEVLWKDRDEVMELWNNEAKVYICGSRAVGDGVKEMLVRIQLDAAARRGIDADEKEMKDWFEGVRNVRYAMDIFD